MLTDAARSRRGIGAVAPALEPYVDATHWPSGAPLPLCITVRRCRRAPKVMTSHVFGSCTSTRRTAIHIHVWLGQAAAVPALGPASRREGIGAYDSVQRPVRAGVPADGAVRLSDVAEHTLALALLLYLDKAAPEVRAQPLRDFRVAANLPMPPRQRSGSPSLVSLYPPRAISI